MIDLPSMKLRVERIIEDEQSCEFATPVGAVNERLASGTHDFRLVGALQADLRHYRAGDELFFSGRVAVRAEATCARCVEAFPLDLDVPFEIILTPASRAIGRAELRPEELALGTYSGDEIDLTPLVEEQAILALPTRALCREDCRGLCPLCGANRNLEPCQCRPATGDARLAVLRGLKVGSA